MKLLQNIWVKIKMREFVKEHIRTIPSEFYDVGKYSERFCEWLEEQDADEFAKETAKLEKLVAECFNMAESQVLEQADLANIAPEGFVNLQLQPREAAILAEF